jgi:hypothetical protein
MRTKSVFISAVVSLLIAIAVYNEGFSQQVEICATCPGNDVLGHKASAFGVSNIASGSYSFVAGLQSEASKPNSVVIGSWSKATGDNSFVIGNFSHALAVDSYVFGNNSTSEFDFSMALGHNILSRNGAFVLGNGRVDAKLTNNHQESLMIGFNSAYPTIFVSRTPVGYQSGRVGIGNITSPEAKLHIRADAGEDASLLLEATSNDNMSRLMLGNNHHIVAGHQSHMRFETASNKGFVLSNGNLGIYSEDPKASVHIQQGDIYIEDIHSGIIMKSPNGQCWRGRLSDNGNLSFEQTDCPEEATAAVSHLPQQDRLRLYPNPTGSSITIETDLHGLYAEVLISTLDGKPISRQQIGSNRMDISLDHFVAGMYLVSLELNRQVVETHKVIKH